MSTPPGPHIVSKCPGWSDAHVASPILCILPLQGIAGLQSKLQQALLFRGAMSPVRLVMTAVNAETGAAFCLVECEELSGSSKNKDLEVVLLEMHCIAKAYGIIKLSMCGDEEREDGVRVKGR